MIHVLTGAPDPRLARALAEFEAQFTYPLGPGRRFSIDHGDHRPRFFRAIGDAFTLVLEEKGAVRGVLSAAIRTLLTPGALVSAAYIGDVKVAPEARSGRTFLKLVRAADELVRPRVQVAYGVVMEGTAATPEQYTGRLGLERFEPIARVLVWRLDTTPERDLPREWVAPLDRVAPCFSGLRRGRFAAVDGRSAERSVMEPVGLVEPGGAACGIVEDTRRAKRLVADDGVEMVSAHLSRCAWRTPAAGAALIAAARRAAAAAGYGALFVAIPEDDAGALASAMGRVSCVVAPARVYGARLSPGVSWLVDTAEI